MLSPSLPAHCTPTHPFLTTLSSHLHICLPTPLALTSSLLGTLSIISWLFAQLPQIIRNYRQQSTTGLSFLFLVIWCLGDSSNLVGAVLTHQAGWQVIVAGYYVFVDVVMVVQFFWYTHFKRKPSPPKSGYRPVSGDDELDHDPAEGSLGSRASVTIRPSEPKDVKFGHGHGVYPYPSLLGQSPSYTAEKFASPRPSITRGSGSSALGSGPGPTPGKVATRTILLSSLLCTVLASAAPTSPPPSPSPSPNPNTTKILLGRIFSYTSTTLYLTSRPPQLIKNHLRKSTSGLSPLLFTAAFLGNLFYSLSLATNPNAWNDFPPFGGHGWVGGHGSERAEWVGRAVPFFLGAAGVLGMDGFMGVQFLVFGGDDDDQEGEGSGGLEERVFVSEERGGGGGIGRYGTL